MGGLVGGIFDLMSGNPTAHEEDKLGGLGNYETGLGESLTSAGANEELGILSGDPTKIAQVESPEISAQQGQIEQNRLQNDNFGTRSGGTAAANQAAEAAGRGNIINLTGNLIGNTAGAAVGQGSGLLGEASTNIGDQAKLAAANQQRMTGDVSGIASDVASIASGLFKPTKEKQQGESSGGFSPEQLTNLDMGAAPSTAGLEGFSQPTSPDLSIFDTTSPSVEGPVTSESQYY